jgi:hypothetical protein
MGSVDNDPKRNDEKVSYAWLLVASSGVTLLDITCICQIARWAMGPSSRPALASPSTDDVVCVRACDFVRAFRGINPSPSFFSLSTGASQYVSTSYVIEGVGNHDPCLFQQLLALCF